MRSKQFVTFPVIAALVSMGRSTANDFASCGSTETNDPTAAKEADQARRKAIGK